MTKTFPPKAQPAARSLALVIAFAFLGVVIVVARELWSMRTGSQLESWLEPIFQVIGRARYQAWMFPAGIAAALVGIWLMIMAVFPRRQTHRGIISAANLWIRPMDIARHCTATAEKIPGVNRASTFATTRLVTVTVTGDPQDTDLAERVQTALSPITAALVDAPRLVVRIQSRNEPLS
ncbi:DUF6286 domain-containing protein [Staphylococcus chromogenes]|nr:DUF6286 domain-containing protein [Staphylococcus chromogenes]